MSCIRILSIFTSLQIFVPISLHPSQSPSYLQYILKVHIYPPIKCLFAYLSLSHTQGPSLSLFLFLHLSFSAVSAAFPIVISKEMCLSFISVIQRIFILPNVNPTLSHLQRILKFIIYTQTNIYSYSSLCLLNTS